MKSVPILHTTRCVLSAVTPTVIPVLRQILDDADTRRFLPELCEVFQTEESLMQFIASFDSYLLQDEGFLWGIHKEDTFIGFIAIIDIPDNPTLFYAMHPDYRSQGLMKESLIAVIDYARGENLFNKLQTEVNKENAISQKLIKDIGFHAYRKVNDKIYYHINVANEDRDKPDDD